MEFETVDSKSTKQSEGEVIRAFLDSINPHELSAQVLDSLGWGDDGDPITMALAVLKEHAKSW